MPKTLGRATKRWGLPAIGLATVACVGCCALPLVAAGGVLGGGLTLLSDPCFTPVWIVLLVVGVVASVAWVVRAPKRSACDEDGACLCSTVFEADVMGQVTSQPRP